MFWATELLEWEVFSYEDGTECTLDSGDVEFYELTANQCNFLEEGIYVVPVCAELDRIKLFYYTDSLCNYPTIYKDGELDIVILDVDQTDYIHDCHDNKRYHIKTQSCATGNELACCVVYFFFLNLAIIIIMKGKHDLQKFRTKFHSQNILKSNRLYSWLSL